jgi:hypothetical protein
LRKPPSSLDVWEIYQRGLWHFYKYNEDDHKTAQAFFLRAIELDPNFAPGHYGFALAQHFNFWAYPTMLSWNEVAGRGREEARLAVSLDDGDWISHVALSFTWEISGDWETSIAEARIAAGLNPNSAWSMLALGPRAGLGRIPQGGRRFLRSGDTPQSTRSADLALQILDGHLPLFLARLHWGTGQHEGGEPGAAKAPARGSLVRGIARPARTECGSEGSIAQGARGFARFH